LYLFGQCVHNQALYESFGFHSQPVCLYACVQSAPIVQCSDSCCHVCQYLIGLTLFSMVYHPVDAAFGFALKVLSRHFEYQADEVCAVAVDVDSCSN
jgi:Zn-dependent protease with chaperone function